MFLTNTGTLFGHSASLTFTLRDGLNEKYRIVRRSAGPLQEALCILEGTRQRAHNFTP